MAEQSNRAQSSDLSETCKLVRTPDGGIRAECTDVESAKQIFEAALRGKFTVVFKPRAEGFRPKAAGPKEE